MAQSALWPHMIFLMDHWLCLHKIKKKRSEICIKWACAVKNSLSFIEFQLICLLSTSLHITDGIAKGTVVERLKFIQVFFFLHTITLHGMFVSC